MNKDKEKVATLAFRAVELRNKGITPIAPKFLGRLVNTMGFPFEIAIDQLADRELQIENKDEFLAFWIITLNQYAEDQINHLRDSGASEKAIERRRSQNIKELSWAIDRLGIEL